MEELNPTCLIMEELILLIFLCSSFCSFAQSFDSTDNGTGEPLDVILHEHGLRSLLFQRQQHETGTLYEVKLPASLSGIMDVSYVRLRSKTLWRKGANFSSFQISSRTLPMPYVKRVVIVYQDLGNLSYQFYNHTVPGYTLVSSVVGFRVYDASNPTTTNVRKLDFNTSDAPISVHFPNLKFPRGAKCASFGGSNGQVSLDDMSVGNVCQSRSYGWFSVVIPKRKKGGVGAWWGVGVGFVMVLLVSFVGMVLVKIMKVKRLDEMEMQKEDGSGDLETVWIGYNKMPCATVTRTHPNLENAGTAT